MARDKLASWAWLWLCGALATLHCGGDDKERSPGVASGGSGGTSGAGGTSSAGSSGADAGGAGGGDAGAAGDGGSNTDTGGAGGSGGTGAGAGMGGEAGQSAVDQPPPGEAGYLDVDSHFFRGGPELDGLTAASTRLFYAFIEADTAPAERPLFVFTGGMPDLTGGNLIPGPASSGLFAVFGVSRTTLVGDELAVGLQQNPDSWTDMGSLLFIDSRQSGFSYSTLEDPGNDGARGAEYAANNFNNFVDAADLLRGLLQFLREHPELTDNPVVLVGQGYASIRINLMQSYLLHPERLYEDAAWNYTDEALADELLDHYASVFPDEASIDPEIAAAQFGWQIHLQPKIGGDQQGITAELWCQPGTPEYEAAEELDESCPPLSRDTLSFDKNAGWSLMLRQASQQALLDPSSFESILFVDPTAVSGLPATERSGAYRLGTMLAVEDAFPRARAVWTDQLGVLEAHDRYYLGNVEQLISGNSNFSEGNDLACLSFIENVQHVAAFVTNAELDGHIRTAALEATLEDCSTYVDAFILESVDSDTAARSGVARAGWLTLNYNATAEIGAASRTVRWPAYAEAGHLVNVSSPAELKQDVREFLEQSGLDVAE